MTIDERIEAIEERMKRLEEWYNAIKILSACKTDVSMTNAEKYKTVEERYTAFLDFCFRQQQCKYCRLKPEDSSCALKWLEQEAEND